MNNPTTTPGRDLRIDFFRGLALVMIFVNHLPYSPLSLATLRNWGLSDSAEVFVLLAGVAAALAYSRIFEQKGYLAGTRAVLARVRTLYGVHLLLFALIGVICWLGAQALGDSSYLGIFGYAPFFEEPLRRLPEALALMFQPGYLDILPLYVVLLGFIPLLIPLYRLHMLAPLVVSLVLYAAMQWAPLHLPNTVQDGGVWFFNPFAWQVLFVIGFTMGQMIRSPKARPALPNALRHTITAFAAFYTALAMLVVGPWREIPGWENAWLVDPNLLAVANKSLLHPLRLFDILTKVWLVAQLIPASSAWLHSMLARPVVAMGRHSLPIFATSTVLAVGGGMVIEALPEIPLSVAVNTVGILLMLGAGLYADMRRKPARAKDQAGVAL
ncbi:MAG: OpgC domain-containing protein [Proteobacteria bacterium]|nr:OpgC domain-containing protein [Pseudomonadota bacterium]